MQQRDHDYTFKLLAIGDSGVGKTSLLMRYAQDTYSETFLATIGVDFKLKTCETEDGKKIKLQIWDTAGQERFRTITSSYYRGSHGVLVLYDITDRDSFQHAEQWLRDVDKYGRGGGAPLQKMLVGCKLDLEHKRAVLENEAREFAESMDVHYIECSAKDTSNVDHVFDLITEHMYVAQDCCGPDTVKALEKRTIKKNAGAVLLKRNNGLGIGNSLTSACGC